ncbi:MAG: methionine adenosyltransferase [Nitrosopumilus sp.]|nr:methionine adenosyltransferase [Nitrosopumilus sp.]MDA7942595.1 methionine adenosyltransferase [Nitrosopumilus sp.]MDA7952517.1 methionine adenosyltransferase [Nitrosopumilus sp.]MDA7958005.1 methionine adenosyltransferase [Nitrosopumilus sp.]MDA7959454.1 methionine adenosyltransferase [Nitrosopumilus sp.]
MAGRHLFTSESVTEGHPDKVCDRISDSILDEYIRQDPDSRVAAEAMVTTDFAAVAGEVTSRADFGRERQEEIVRGAIREIGYVGDKMGFDADKCTVDLRLHSQSPDISMGVDRSGGELGAGDQGLMFGFAIDETDELMPLPILLSHRLAEELTRSRRDGRLPWARPDGKSQVSVIYEDGRPAGIDTVVVSTQHGPDISQEKIRRQVIDEVVRPVLGERWDNGIKIHVNPTGRFEIGGPHGDAGLTGRKIIVDTYGGYGRHGGGAFSGKDPSKVDRSACYMARYIAKNVVAAGIASKFEVQLAYAIGVSKPVSLHANTFGTGKIPDEKIERIISEEFDTTPAGIIKELDLKKPIYKATSAYGHFGRKEFSWERTDRAGALQAAAGL